TGRDTGASGTASIVVMREDAPVVPASELWFGSGHADQDAEAFTHWDEDGEIPQSCAKCHSTPGYLDFLGEDGSAAGVVDAPAPIGTQVHCEACHNASASGIALVKFPSGDTVAPTGNEGRCMECHQGRSSTVQVDAAIAAANVPTDDTVSDELRFINIHYYAAAASRYGGLVRGGYEYSNAHYDVFFEHFSTVKSCTHCHDMHTLEVRFDYCLECHTGISSPREIRMASSFSRDYDGDGVRSGAILSEIQGLVVLCYDAIQAYARDVTGEPIIYEGHTYPYFFHDTNGNGEVDPGEAIYPNQYSSWTARLLRAAYNYQVANKDPGGYAHNAKYIIQLLHDSIADINSVLPVPIDMTAADRDDPGHFEGSSEAFRHWDDTMVVPANCAKCHSGAVGLLKYLHDGENADELPVNGLECNSCHKDPITWVLNSPDSVTFPSDITITMDPPGDPEDPEMISNLCMTCHSGRESKKTIDEAIAAGDLSFKNIHYLPAGATLFGADVVVGYEYTNKVYAGQWGHAANVGNCGVCHSPWFRMPPPISWWDHSGGPKGNQCTDCHSAVGTEHSFELERYPTTCQNCHFGLTDINQIRVAHTDDYNGNGDDTEPLRDEIAGLAADLLTEIQAVATDAGSPVAYDAHAYPYFFNDNNPTNGIVDEAEANYGNRYQDWTAALMKAAHNYQFSQKEPGAWAHNFAYMTQLLIDSIEDLGGDISGYVRP
ncbi:MAG: cytochrome c3 family protein, partial [Planctomycetota bacterium]